MQHISLSIFDHNKKKVCELYDSSFPVQGQAYDIVYSEEIKLGWKELSFALPYSVDKQRNFRWDYIKNDYLVRLINGDTTEWFTLTAPKKTKNGKAQTNTIKCSHISTNLKTKNLYLVLDDDNGIGTAEYLINKVLVNTGWTLGNCDTFYEKDGITEKIRSISSKGKRGTYQLISDICDIFNAYPVYYGDPTNPKVDIRALENKLPIGELYIGKNLDSISKEHSSDNLVTRLYVEGQYSDNGYVGIDNASDNPTRLPFLLNFDYYKSTGQLTPEQEAAIIQYERDYYENNQLLMAQMRTILDGEDILNIAWGQPKYVLYQLLNGNIIPDKTIYGGNVQDEDKTINPHDKLLVFKESGNYREVEADATGYVQFSQSDLYALKFITLPAGNIGARQVAIESKEKMIRSTQDKLDNQFEIIRQPANRYAEINDTVTFDVEANGPVVSYQWQRRLYGQSTWTNVSGDGDHLSVTLTKELVNSQYRCVLTNDDGMSVTSNSAILFEGDGENIDNPEQETSQKRQYYTDLINNYEDMIDKIYDGTAETTGQYEAMRAAVDVVLQLDIDRKRLAEQQSQQDEIEATFAAAMGDLQKDGYWANTNYAPGQENELYYDALSYLSQTSKPKVKYGISLIRLPELMGFTEGVPLLNSKVRIWDEEMKLNDIAYVSKRTIYLDDPRKGSIEISNEEIASAISKTLDDVFEKMTQLADLVNQRNAIYERARIINENGTLPTENLVGTISIQEHVIESPKSLWHTDETGALIFESPDGESAFKLDGSGIQIAFDQFEGEWDWESLMDGYGIDASYLSGGYVSGDLIEEGSIDFTRMNDNFRTQYYQDERQMSLTAQETDKNGNILRQAGIYLTASGKIEYAEDNELNVKSIITQTAGEVKTELYAADSKLGAYITQSASEVKTELYATDSKLGSYVTQTAGEVKTELYAADSKLGSYIDQTASSIEQVVYSTESNLSSKIEQEAGRISLVVEGTGSNAQIKTASIITEINQQSGDSIAYINADKIKLDGEVIVGEVQGLGYALTVNNAAMNRLNLLGDDNDIALHCEGRIYLAGTYIQLDSDSYMFGPSASFDDIYIGGGSSQTDGTKMNDGVYSIEANTEADPPDGKIGFKVTKYDGDSYNVNFNIADTKYYKNGVSAAEESITAGIVDGDNAPVSGDQYVDANSFITLYPARYVGGIFSSKNTDAKVIVHANASSVSSNNIDIANANEINVYRSDPGSNYANLGQLGNTVSQCANNSWVTFRATCNGGVDYKYYKIHVNRPRQ